MSVTVNPGLNNSPASATAAVITIAAVVGKQHNISSLVWSYDGTPAAGNLKVEDGSGNTVFSVDITAGGPGFIAMSPVLRGSTNTALIVTLSSGGSGVTGKINVPSYWSTSDS